MTSWSVPLADVHVPDEDIEVVAEVYRSGSGDWSRNMFEPPRV